MNYAYSFITQGFLNWDPPQEFPIFMWSVFRPNEYERHATVQDRVVL